MQIQFGFQIHCLELIVDTVILQEMKSAPFVHTVLRVDVMTFLYNSGEYRSLYKEMLVSACDILHSYELSMHIREY